MDIFKYNPTGEQTVLERGEIINELTSKMWVERYSDVGEFSLEAPLATGLKDKLPLGTLISQIDSYEVMIVETHNIKEEKDEDPILVVSGRSFPSYLEERVVAITLARSSSTINPPILASDESWDQAITLINQLVQNTGAGSLSSDILSHVIATKSISGISSPVVIERTVGRGDAWKEVQGLMAIDNVGIRTIRENHFGVVGSGSTTSINLYTGVDRSDEVIFSWIAGDLDSAEYLWSIKNSKNAAVVVGKWIQKVITTTPDKYDRRFMLVDGGEIDDAFDTVPSGGDLTTVLSRMDTLGKKAIAKQNNITLTQADISETTNYQYRRDFNVGDLVTVDGNFGEVAIMRVAEYAEIEDENGQSGHPTLELPIPT